MSAFLFCREVEPLMEDHRNYKYEKWHSDQSVTTNPVGDLKGNILVVD